MTNDAYQKALQKRDLLRREIEKIEDFLEVYRELTGTEPVRSEVKAPVSPARVVRSYGRKRKRGTVKPSDLAPMVGRILVEHGAPMTRSELLAALAERDVVLAGEDKAKYLGTILWRMREAFVNLEGHGYWPRELAYDPAGYRPDIDEAIGSIVDIFDKTPSRETP